MRQKIEPRIIDLSGLEKRVLETVDVVTVANALCLYCGWRAKDEPLEWLEVFSGGEEDAGQSKGDATRFPLNRSRVVIGLREKRAEVYRASEGFGLLMHETFKRRRNFYGFCDYLRKYVHKSSRELKKMWYDFYWKSCKKAI
ncbi:MAG: hypothetical protein ABIB47_05485 [Candidatus Woesearchaeota archaeon]